MQSALFYWLALSQWFSLGWAHFVLNRQVVMVSEYKQASEHVSFVFLINFKKKFWVPHHLLWLWISTHPSFHLGQKLGPSMSFVLARILQTTLFNVSDSLFKSVGPASWFAENQRAKVSVWTGKKWIFSTQNTMHYLILLQNLYAEIYLKKHYVLD